MFKTQGHTAEYKPGEDHLHWDAERYGASVKLSPPDHDGLPTGEPERLRKFFHKADLGRISKPATIVDMHGKILTIFLPDILSPCHVDHINTVTKRLHKVLGRSLTASSATDNPWRSSGFCAPDCGGQFGAGRITISPGYFMQRQERIQDPLVISASYSSADVQNWVAALSITEFFWNAITAAVAPDLFKAGSTAISDILQELSSNQDSLPPASRWPSIFSGLEVIVNRVTLSHRDAGGSPTLFDLLVSLGTGHTATMKLADVQAELDYFPGTMLYIAGRVLEHSVGPWVDGERFVIAHFMRDKVHDRMGVPRPNFPMQSFFLEMVGKEKKGRESAAPSNRILAKARVASWYNKSPAERLGLLNNHKNHPRNNAAAPTETLPKPYGPVLSPGKEKESAAPSNRILAKARIASSYKESSAERLGLQDNRK
ncbi:hypothetical protein BDR03DRAFT_1017653 [Suillus americanus]|nr:hypothetical protein BDR03DRAFT_1017653 [Suillus americanus]